MEKKQSIGGLWLKTSKKGTTYLSGDVEINGSKTRIVVFKNDKKGNDKAPEYRIYQSEELQKSLPGTKDDPNLPF